MKTSEHILHIAKLNNNCPECYNNDGLEISFVQEELENRFYSKSQNSITETIFCKNCKTIIYPVSWTPDIDSVYTYHKKQVIPKKSSLRLKPISYTLIFLVIGLLTTLIYFLGS